jgi:hypothetical protein
MCLLHVLCIVAHTKEIFTVICTYLSYKKNLYRDLLKTPSEAGRNVNRLGAVAFY